MKRKKARRKSKGENLTKHNKKTLINIDGIDYSQIRKDNDSEPEWWKNQPQTPPGIVASGLHTTNGRKDQEHYDFYEDKKELDMPEEYVEKKIGGVFANQNGVFVIPPDKIWIMNEPIPTFISQEEYEKNKSKYKMKIL